jgi:hypothetical protein
MNQTVNHKNILIVGGIMLLGILVRLIPNMPNFSPYIGVALFGGAMLPKKTWAIIGTTAMLYLGDLLLNNTVARPFFTDYEGFVWGAPYMIFNLAATVIMVVFASYFLRKPSMARLGGSALVAAIVFFIISNFGVWVSSEVAYPKTMAGLMQCYTAAIPFFKGTLMSAVVYTVAMFGIHRLLISEAKPSLEVTVD